MHPMQRCNKIIIKNNYKESSHYFATYNERTITVTILLFYKSNLKLGNRKLAGPVVIVSMVLICLCDGEEKIWNGLEIPFDLQHQLFPCKLHFNWVGIIHLLFYYKQSLNNSNHPTKRSLSMHFNVKTSSVSLYTVPPQNCPKVSNLYDWAND